MSSSNRDPVLVAQMSIRNGAVVAQQIDMWALDSATGVEFLVIHQTDRWVLASYHDFLFFQVQQVLFKISKMLFF